MEQLPKTIASVVERWPEPAQLHFVALRSIVQDAAQAADIGE
jgi:hypothetical protein